MNFCYYYEKESPLEYLFRVEYSRKKKIVREKLVFDYEIK